MSARSARVLYNPAHLRTPTTAHSRTFAQFAHLMRGDQLPASEDGPASLASDLRLRSQEPRREFPREAPLCLEGRAATSGASKQSRRPVCHLAESSAYNGPRTGRLRDPVCAEIRFTAIGAGLPDRNLPTTVGTDAKPVPSHGPDSRSAAQRVADRSRREPPGRAASPREAG